MRPQGIEAHKGEKPELPNLFKKKRGGKRKKDSLEECLM